MRSFAIPIHFTAATCTITSSRPCGRRLPTSGGERCASISGEQAPSGGHPAEGIKDAEDLITVSEYLNARSPGRIDLAAYSYGAWATMEAVRMGLSPDSLILISPPLDFISFEGLKLPAAPGLVTIGNQDDFCSVESLKKWLSSQPYSPVTLEIFPYTDHFYWGSERELYAKIAAFLSQDFVSGNPLQDTFDKNGEQPY